MQDPKPPPGAPTPPSFTNAAAPANPITSLSDRELQDRFAEGIAEMGGARGAAPLTITIPRIQAVLAFMYLQIGLAHPQARGSAAAAIAAGVARHLQAAIAPGPIVAEIFRRGWVKVPGAPEAPPPDQYSENCAVEIKPKPPADA